MNEYIYDINPEIVFDFVSLEGFSNVFLKNAKEEIVRCRDCKYGYEVYWPANFGIPSDYLDCTGPLVTTWDYYRDEPKDNPVPPDGFCKWGERRESAISREFEKAEGLRKLDMIEDAITGKLNSRAERTCKQEERGWGTEGDHARVWLTCGHDCMVPTVQDLPNYCPNCGAKVVDE